MKTNKIASIILLIIVLIGACKQSPIEPVDPTPVTVVPADPGSADFGKFVSLGDSYAAGAQGGALFTSSQANSLSKILATQMVEVGGGAFNQPDVNHENGLNFVIFAGSGGAVSLGRYVLFDPDGDLDPDGAGCNPSRSAAPRAAGTPYAGPVCPSTSTTPAMPAPYNTVQLLGGAGGLLSYAGNPAIANLNNFGVPGTRIFHTNAAAYGAAPPTGSPWFFRMASNPGTTDLLTDASSKGHTFFMLSIGLSDIMSYASSGGVGSINGIGAADMTPEATFNALFDLNLGTMLGASAKGVVTTIPDITSLPFFFTVTYNNIELKSTNCNDAAIMGGLNQIFGGYNAALDAILAGAVGPVPPGYDAADNARRKVLFKYGKNPILINDETLVDLGPQLSAVSPLFAQYGKLRPATATDLILLSAGSILGTCAPGPPTGWPATLPFLYGLGSPLSDGSVLIPTETADIQARTTALNAHMAAAAATYPGRVAVADINAAYKTLVTYKAYISDGVTIVPSFAPPAGMFSEDGVHPNSRGYAATANFIIDAINAEFGANLHHVNIALYPPTGLPIKGQ